MPEPVSNRLAQSHASCDTVIRHGSIGRLLRDAAEKAGARTALIMAAAVDQPERRWTYRELQREAYKTAWALRRKFAPGDRIATWAASSPEFLVLQLGAALAGLPLVTMNPANRAAEIDYMLTQTGARGLFYDASFRGQDNDSVLASVRRRLPNFAACIRMDRWERFLADAESMPLDDVSPGAPALILFTSGSTGKPKAAVLHHAGMINNAALTARHLGVAEGETWLNVLPMFHIGGSGTVSLGCMAQLGTQVMIGAYSPEAVLDALERYRVSFTMLVPTMLVGILQSPRLAGTDLSALKLITVGGSAVAPELVRQVKRAMQVDVASLMGQTEASGALFATQRGDREDQVTQSVGRPIAPTVAKIVATADGHTLKIGEVGEICIRSPWMMREYFGMPEKTRETIDAGGWLHTGDVGYMRDDGYVQITGRLKEMIIRGGENIYPREIEDTLLEHPDVAQAAVVGVPDPKWGELVAAAVMMKPQRTLDAAALSAFLGQRIAQHKVPRLWRAVEQFPLNASGKIQKFLLAEQFAAQGAIHGS